MTKKPNVAISESVPQKSVSPCPVYGTVRKKLPVIILFNPVWKPIAQLPEVSIPFPWSRFLITGKKKT